MQRARVATVFGYRLELDGRRAAAPRVRARRRWRLSAGTRRCRGDEIDLDGIDRGNRRQDRRSCDGRLANVATAGTAMGARRDRSAARGARGPGRQHAVSNVSYLNARRERVGPGVHVRLNHKALDRDGQHAKKREPGPAPSSSSQVGTQPRHSGGPMRRPSASASTPVYGLFRGALQSAELIFETDQAPGATHSPTEGSADNARPLCAAIHPTERRKWATISPRAKFSE